MPKTKKLKFDRDKWEEALKEPSKNLAATRGNTVDDVDDLQDSLPLDRTVAIFYGHGTKRVP